MGYLAKWLSSRDSRRLGEIWDAVQELKEEMKLMKISLDNLIAAVTDETTVVKSAVVLIDGLEQKVNDLSATLADQPAVQAKVDELATAISASKAELAAAVAANTPDEPPPVGGLPPTP